MGDKEFLDLMEQSIDRTMDIIKKGETVDDKLRLIIKELYVQNALKNLEDSASADWRRAVRGHMIFSTVAIGLLATTLCFQVFS